MLRLLLDVITSYSIHYTKLYEKKLENNIESLLEKTVGPGKVRAEVSVEMDFDKVVTNSESYDPDQQVVRSTSTVEETSLRNNFV